MQIEKTKRNNLRYYRARNGLSLSDTSFLLDMDTGNLSKYEKRELTPTLKVAISYHLLFDLPLETLIDHDFKKIQSKLIDRLFHLAEELNERNRTKNVNNRIEAVHNLITRLNHLPINEG